MLIGSRITRPEVILDTVPLLFFLLGTIANHPHIKQHVQEVANIKFTEGRAKLLFTLLRDKKKIVTPQILAELSNQAEKHIDHDTFLRANIRNLFSLSECHIKKEDLLSDLSLFKFGLGDISLVKAGSSNRTLITTEMRGGLKCVYEDKHGEVVLLQNLLEQIENINPS